MDQINNQMAMVTAQAKLTMPIEQGRRHARRWSESTEKMVLLLFSRLGDLFSNKASVKGLVIFDNLDDEKKGIYTETFELWCRKLDGLTIDDFKKGMEGLEAKAEESYRLGDEMWPPSYAEFRALAFPKTDRDAIAHKPFERQGLPEPKEYRSKRYSEGVKQCKDILAMLETPPPTSKPMTEAEIKDNEKLQRIKGGL